MRVLAGWADRMAGRWLARRGYAVVRAGELTAARQVLDEVTAYVRRSGHLNTVSGRRPRSVAKVLGAMSLAHEYTAPADLSRNGRGTILVEDGG